LYLQGYPQRTRNETSETILMEFMLWVSLYSWFPYTHGFLILMVSLYSRFPYTHGFLIYSWFPYILMVFLYSWFPYTHGFLILMVSLYSWFPYTHGFLIVFRHCKLVSFLVQSLTSNKKTIFKAEDLI